MNYVILNGKDSRDIKGLIIQSLPSIFKPNIRATIEEIDGRDGDIITKLGYSAYDKEMSIGLYGDYDIDEVISFFDSEGLVTFSNEPDKYYRYTILKEIEFERLIRYRTATVTLHVQPFKFAVNELPKVFENPTSGIVVRNNGNVIARPVIEITGTGNINLSLNGVQLFKIELGDQTSITIDTAEMEAYSGGNLMNRNVTGNYDNFVLKVGKNTISWDGTIKKITFRKYSRWL